MVYRHRQATVHLVLGWPHLVAWLISHSPPGGQLGRAASGLAIRALPVIGRLIVVVAQKAGQSARDGKALKFSHVIAASTSHSIIIQM